MKTKTIILSAVLTVAILTGCANEEQKVSFKNTENEVLAIQEQELTNEITKSDVATKEVKGEKIEKIDVEVEKPNVIEKEKIKKSDEVNEKSEKVDEVNQIKNIENSKVEKTSKVVKKEKIDNVEKTVEKELIYILNVNGELVNGEEIFGERVYQLENLRGKYHYVSDFDLLLNDGYGKLLKEIDEFNKDIYSIYDYDGNEIKGKERLEEYGEYAFFIMDEYKDKYKYLSNYEILETYIFGDDFMNEINSKNEFLYSVYDYDGNEIDGYEVYGQQDIGKMRSLKEQYPYVTNYEILENYWIGVNDINEFNKDTYSVIDYDGKQVDGFKIYGEYVMNYFMLNKYKYENVTNYEFLETYFIMDALDDLNNKRKNDKEVN